MDDKRIWLPLYQVGPEAHYWLDDFASDFFSEGINNQSESENFISKLIYLFETIQQIDSWKSRRHDASKIWCSFLGLESSAHLRLTEENCDFALKILKVYERWLTINSSNAECIGKFANLLSLKYSKKIRTKLFCQMMPLIESEDLGSYYNRWNMDYFSSLLTVLWIDHRDDMKNNSELKNCFNLLLSKLLPSNQPKVIEISNQFKYLR